MSDQQVGGGDTVETIQGRHSLFGWSSLAFFMTLGLVLEGLHGLKAAFYLDAVHQLRREMWTLAHAHGTLLALINLAFVSQLPRIAPRMAAARLKIVSFLILDASLLLPLGFFAGGLFATEHDPWIGILLTPLGAVCLIAAVGMVAMALRRRPY